MRSMDSNANRKMKVILEITEKWKLWGGRKSRVALRIRCKYIREHIKIYKALKTSDVALLFITTHTK